jgi:hypothetical protein
VPLKICTSSKFYYIDDHWPVKVGALRGNNFEKNDEGITEALKQ